MVTTRKLFVGTAIWLLVPLLLFTVSLEMLSLKSHIICSAAAGYYVLFGAWMGFEYRRKRFVAFMIVAAGIINSLIFMAVYNLAHSQIYLIFYRLYGGVFGNAAGEIIDFETKVAELALEMDVALLLQALLGVAVMIVCITFGAVVIRCTKHGQE